MRVLITGANGFIGRNLSRLLGRDHLVDSVSREQLDLLDPIAVKSFFDGKRYHLVIHTAVEGGRRTMVDTNSVVYNNILMVYNLLENQDSFDRIIVFGSGAELDRRLDINQDTDEARRYPIDFYGMSKSIIHKISSVEPKLYNFRVFNCFGEDESSDRMIRGNIERYIRMEPLQLFSNRLMDFFYIDDLHQMIEYFLKTPFFPKKTINCVYREKIRLNGVLAIINELGSHKVPIIRNYDDSPNSINTNDTDYVGVETTLPIEFIGLKGGIEKMYKQLLGAQT